MKECGCRGGKCGRRGRRPATGYRLQRHRGIFSLARKTAEVVRAKRRFGQPFRKPERVGRRYGKAQRPAVGLHFDQQRAVPVRSYGSASMISGYIASGSAIAPALLYQPCATIILVLMLYRPVGPLRPVYSKQHFFIPTR
jgi:hypothetical protein